MQPDRTLLCWSHQGTEAVACRTSGSIDRRTVRASRSTFAANKPRMQAVLNELDGRLFDVRLPALITGCNHVGGSPEDGADASRTNFRVSSICPSSGVAAIFSNFTPCSSTATLNWFSPPCASVALSSRFEGSVRMPAGPPLCSGSGYGFGADVFLPRCPPYSRFGRKSSGESGQSRLAKVLQRERCCRMLCGVSPPKAGLCAALSCSVPEKTSHC